MELCAARFIDTTYINPEKVKIVFSGLICTKLEFAITFSLSICSVNYVFKSNFVLFVSPGVRKDRVRRYLLINALHKSEAAIALALQKAHGGGDNRGTGNQCGRMNAPPTFGEDATNEVDRLQNYVGTYVLGGQLERALDPTWRLELNFCLLIQVTPLLHCNSERAQGGHLVLTDSQATCCSSNKAFAIHAFATRPTQTPSF